MQENLRLQVKIAKVVNEDLFSYKDLAEYLNMNTHSFYNWLAGYYCLGTEKEKKLQDFLNDIL